MKGEVAVSDKHEDDSVMNVHKPEYSYEKHDVSSVKYDHTPINKDIYYPIKNIVKMLK